MRWFITSFLLAAASATLAELQLDSIIVDISPDETLVLDRRENTEVRVDGHLDESVWHELPAYDEFVVLQPDTLSKPEYATRVQSFYDERGLYFGIDMEQPVETLITRLSGRDRLDIEREQIGVVLDTSGEGRYGYWFGVYLGDSVVDGTVLPERKFSNEWDGAWRAATQQTESGWSAEFYIPWGTVSMPVVQGKRKLGIYMSRLVAYRDESYGWPTLPFTRPQFMSKMQGLEVEGIDPRQQYSIYPFAAVSDDRFDGVTRYRTGVDFLWRPSSGFQLSATVNPDFGAVESDDVIINLSATETFFPEKRLFFVEGQEIFVTSPRADTRRFGVGRSGLPTTLINTRRIGGKPLEPKLAPDYEISDRELDQPVELAAAVKVTGQSGRIRYGAMAAFEDDFKFDVELNGEPVHLEGEPSDYAVARILYEDAPGGAYKALGYISTAILNDNRQAKTHGIDAHYLSAGGKLTFDGQLFLSDIVDEETGQGGFLDFEYNFRKGVTQRLGIEWADDHVNINDMGFIGRNSYRQIRTAHSRTNSDLSWARTNEFDLRGFVQKNSDDLLSGAAIFLSNRTTFQNLDQFTIHMSYSPESYDDLNSFGNGTYRIEEQSFLGLSYDSDGSQEFSYGLGLGVQEEHLGDDTLISRLSFSWRPDSRFAVNFEVRHFKRKGWLLHQEDRNMTSFDAEQWIPNVSAEYFISARQQLKFSLQWVGIKAQEKDFYRVADRAGDLIEVAKPPGPPDSFSLSQMALQLRYRWEIAPLSDIFVVYTRQVDEGSRLKSFSETFSDGYDNPALDALIFKIRYRFGS